MRSRDYLRRYPLFNVLSTQQLDQWLASGQGLSFALGELLFQEGSDGACIYLLLEGRVRVLRHAESENREKTVSIIERGEIFGEYALLPPHRNTATCRAASAVQLLRLPLHSLREQLTLMLGTRLKDWLRLHGLVHYLRKQSFQGFMSAPSALTFLERLQPVEFRAQQTIQADGLGADRWYFVEKGQVELQQTPITSAKSTTLELGPGDCFGERALLGRSGLPIALAQSEVRCQCLPREIFAPLARRSADESVQSLELRPCAMLKEFAWVGQREESDCGVAALAMIAHFFGKKVSLEQLRAQIPIGKQGAALSDLQQVGHALGLRCLSARVDVDRFDQIQLPALVHQHSGHYVVLYQIGSDGMIVGDPATGLVRMSRGEFAPTCSGNLLLVRGK